MPISENNLNVDTFIGKLSTMEETTSTVTQADSGAMPSLVKPNAGTMHITYKGLLSEHRIWWILFSHAWDELQDTDKHQFTISWSTLASRIGRTRPSILKIKGEVTRLKHVLVEWNILNHAPGDWDGLYSLLSGATDDRQGNLIYSFDPQLREKLVIDEGAQWMAVDILNVFRSKYAFALYVLLNEAQRQGETTWLSVNTYRRLMGIEDGKYTDWRDLYKRVILAPMQEVNERSNLSAEIVLTMEGGRYIGFRFNQITLKPDHAITKLVNRARQEQSQQPLILEGYIGLEGEEGYTSQEQDVAHELAQAGFQSAAIRDDIREFGAEYLLEQIPVIKAGLVNHQRKNKRPHSNPVGYWRACFRNNRDLWERRQQEAGTQEDAQGELPSPETLIEDLMDSIRTFHRMQMVKWVKSIPAEQQEILAMEFGRYLQERDRLLYGFFERDGLLAARTRVPLQEFISKSRGKWQPGAVAVEEYLASPGRLAKYSEEQIREVWKKMKQGDATKF